jgi:flagellar hook-associated protein 2
MGVDLFVNQNSNMERLIQTILQIESEPRFRLEDKKAELEKRNTVLSDLDSKLSTLQSTAKTLTDPLTNHFAAKSASSSDSNKFSATAGSDALASNHDISILRLATSDTRVSQQYDSSGTAIKSFFDSNGAQTFEIEVAHPTDEDENNRVSIEVTVTPTGTDDDDIMSEIALAINNALSSAVQAGTIASDEKISASVVHEENGKSRLIFKSGQSGYTNRLDFTDSASGLLSTLQITNAAETSGTSGGYVTAVGTSASDSELNAQLKIDGLTFYRDSNTINDILDDVTMTLKDVTETTESLKVSIDSEQVKQKVNEYLNAYNDVLTYIKAKSAVDPKLNVRGPLAGETTYTFLRSNLRSLMSNQVSGLATGQPQYLHEIGIEAATDGKLSIKDDEKFEDALAASSTYVSDLFNSSNGVAAQIKSFLESYVKVGGILDDSVESNRDRITGIDGRISRFDQRLAQREFQLRQQFAKMQETAQLLGGQSSSFASIAQYAGF